MKMKLTPGGFYGALIVVFAAWTLYGFLEALLAACVTAIASWPLYRRFRARVPSRSWRATAPLLFTCLVTVFVLAPLMFAFTALVSEGHAMLLDIAAADRKGIAVPAWLVDVPVLGTWLAERWQGSLAKPGALSAWAQKADTAALFTLAQSLGHFMARQLYIIGFTVLLLFFLYDEGEPLAERLRRKLRCHIGDRADAYANVATAAISASVNSMLLVGLCVGSASWAAYAIAGAPHAGLWAAVTGALSFVPFLGYGAAAALSLQLATKGAAASAVLTFVLGCAILFVGDKLVRPAVARGGTHLPFVWVLMGCLGGFEALGLVGVVVGPVALALARELWRQHVGAA